MIPFNSPLPAMKARALVRWLATPLCVATLAACSFVPKYEQPAAPVSATWPDSAGAQVEGGVAAADLPWQQFVHDAQLREVIQLALENNRDLRVAVQNIEQARAQYQIRSADQFPTVGASASGTRSAPNPMQALGGPSVSSNYTVGIGVAGWELDFFGRVAALKDVALANYLATEEARKAAQISLIAAVSSTWLQLKTDTELLLLTERTLGTREQSLRLTRLRGASGVTTAGTGGISRSGIGWPTSSVSRLMSCARRRCCWARVACALADSDSASRMSSADDAPLSKRSLVSLSDSARVRSVSRVSASSSLSASQPK